MASIAERFWPKVRFGDDCWEWTAARSKDGYGAFKIKNKLHVAHRVAWELCCEPIADGLVIDHLCRNKGCVNPSHMEVVTQKVNMLRGMNPMAKNARKTRCVRGHTLSLENLAPNNKGYRICKLCRRIREKVYNQKPEYKRRHAADERRRRARHRQERLDKPELLK